jgi:GDP-L-fucose synthase
MDQNSRIYIAGHRGLVGSAICRRLRTLGFNELLLRRHAELDLTDARVTENFFEAERPDYVFLAAAKVGGILANDTYPADFIRENLRIQANVIEASYRVGVRRLIFLGSSCIYPKVCPQPIKEEYLLTGALEPTNRAYALAKIAGIELCWAYNRQFGTRYLSVMPTNIYGSGDNYDLQSSHMLPALIRRVAEAKAEGRRQLSVWGSGTPRRELLYSDDIADACVFLINLPKERYSELISEEEPPLINVGTNIDFTIREIAELVCRVLKYDGEIVLDPSKPDGTPRKLLDSSRINALGWHAKISLERGIQMAYDAFKTKTVEENAVL